MDALDPIASVRGLSGFPGRGAGTDAERRAAIWLADQYSAGGQAVDTETFWCRPNWALAHLWHVGLALSGSLTALASPIVGIALLALALVSVSADAISGVSLGRRLTPERASQNVVVTTAGGTQDPPTQLILTANYDAGRVGLAYRLRPLTARLTGATRGLTPGWLGWLCLAIIWLLVVAILRQDGHTSQAIGALQLPPTVGLLLGFALLLELATADWSPAAGDNASGVAAVRELGKALSAAPPRNLQVKIVLTGAGDAEQIGLRHHLSTLRATGRFDVRRARRRSADTLVLGIATSAGGRPRWWESDGALLPLRYGAALRRTAAEIAEQEPHMQAASHRGRSNGNALPARAAGLPALTIGSLKGSDLPADSHRGSDLPDTVDPQAIDRTVQFALLLIDAIDTAVGQGQRRSAPTPA